MTIRRLDERYSLEREIGRGGSGPVWLGNDAVLGRRVAIKQIGMPPGADDADALRAEREARLAAKVNHPHVVAVFDLVESGDQHWLVMEYVDGETLSERIRRDGAMTPEQAAPLLRQAAEALSAAHAAGIVHRDVKPSNMLIDSDGSVKLSDFGIARALADASLTQTGLVTGSPAYLSPEVASGSSATPASDVWSFGATLFHTLAGAPPYEVGENLMGALYRIVNEDPPRLATAGVLAPLLEATMTKDPAGRPAMADVVAYLDRDLSAPAGLAPAVAPAAAAAAATPAAATEETSFLPPTHRDDSTRRTWWVPGLIGAAALLVVVMIVAILALSVEDETPAAAPNSTDNANGPSETAPSSSATEETSAPPEAPTAGEMEQFARTYVETASDDPAEGFTYLTPAYQRQSPQYEDFWGSVINPRISSVSGDPDAMQVTYTYSYSVRGSGRRTETVTLNLVQDGDRLLIASAS